MKKSSSNAKENRPSTKNNAVTGEERRNQLGKTKYASNLSSGDPIQPVVARDLTQHRRRDLVSRVLNEDSRRDRYKQIQASTSDSVTEINARDSKDNAVTAEERRSRLGKMKYAANLPSYDQMAAVVARDLTQHCRIDLVSRVLNEDSRRDRYKQIQASTSVVARDLTQHPRRDQIVPVSSVLNEDSRQNRRKEIQAPASEDDSVTEINARGCSLRQSPPPHLLSQRGEFGRWQPPVLRLQKSDVCIIGVARTPIGALFGSLRSLSAVELGACAIRGAIRRARIDLSQVQEVFMGNVLKLETNVARRAALMSGLHSSTSCTTVSQAGSSGMRAISLAAQSIKLGLQDVVVGGGMESMSDAFESFGEEVHRLVYEVNIEAYKDLCSVHKKALEKYASVCLYRGGEALKDRTFRWETVPVTNVKPPGSSSVITVDCDEGHSEGNIWPNIGGGEGAMPAAGDGAAALVLVSRAKVKELNLQVHALVLGYAAVAGEENAENAIIKALKKAKLQISQIDYFEICETFPARVLETQKKVELTNERVNIHGGAAFLRHPLGCSGARAVVTLLGVLIEMGARYGVAAVYGAGEGSSALVIERR